LIDERAGLDLWPGRDADAAGLDRQRPYGGGNYARWY